MANLNRILDRAQAVGVPVEVDMEDSSLISDTLALFREAATRIRRRGSPSRQRCAALPLDLEALAPLKPRIRLVKGAYAEPVEVAQQGKQRDQGAVQVPHRLAVPVTAPTPRSAPTTTN